jgi:hypothetical protein
MSVIVFFFAKEIHVIFTTPITFLPVTLMFFVIIYYVFYQCIPLYVTSL